MNRDLFVAAYDGRAFVAVPFAAGRAQPVDEVVMLIALAHNARIEEGSPELDVSPERYDAFSWNIMPLGGDLRLAQIPRPGVLLAIHEEAAARVGAEAGGSGAVATLLRQELDKGEGSSSERFHRFLEGPAARWRPLPITTVDVFVSFNPADRLVVDDLTRRLDEKGVSFIASSRGEQGEGAEDVRAGIAAAALVLSVVSPSSVNDPWVLCEMGAAWALDRPILPGRLDVEPDELPDLMASYQSRPVASDAAREQLVDELDAFLTSRLEE